MDELTDAERILEEGEPGYLARVRLNASRLGVGGQGPDLIRDSIDDLKDLVHIDIEPPTYASQPGRRALKNLIKRLTQWYIRYIATQVSALGEAMITLSQAVADRLDDLEGSNRKLEASVDELRHRVQALEPPEKRPD